MPHTYADLLELADAAQVITDGQVLEERKPNEAEDDPHRLARMNLEKYATRHDGRTIRFWRNEWYVWRRGKYDRIEESELRLRVTDSIKEEFDRLNLERIEEYEQAKEDGKIDPEKDKGIPEARKVSKILVGNVLQATGGIVCVSAKTEVNTWLPTKERKNYISMKNGILDLDKLLLLEPDYMIDHSPQWFSMVSLPYEFNPDATCPRWDEFLNYNLELDPERIKLLQEWAGYLLLPDTGEQKFMVLEGEGSNGKSVFISAVTAMLGEDNVSTVSLENFGDRFSRTDTLGKLLNAAGDCGELDKAAEGFLKSFTSGDRMFFDRKGVPGINCRPTARMMIACNNRPRFADRTEGVWRRMLLVPWRVRITRDKRIKGMDKTEWWQKSGELPGIFRWAVIGLQRLRAQRGFTESEVMKEALNEYKEEMNPTRSFLANFTEFTGRGSIKATFLYSLYRKWAQENGYMPLSERPFGKEVKRCFQDIERRQKGSAMERFWIYQGLQFSQDYVCGEATSNGMFVEQNSF